MEQKGVKMMVVEYLRDRETKNKDKKVRKDEKTKRGREQDKRDG